MKQVCDKNAKSYLLSFGIGVGVLILTNCTTTSVEPVIEQDALNATTSVRLHTEDFENGWGPYFCSFGEDCNLSSDPDFAYNGTHSVNIQDDNGYASSLVFYDTSGIAAGFTRVRVSFRVRLNDMEDGEQFHLKYFNQGQFETVWSWTAGDNVFNDVPHSIGETFEVSSANLIFLFECDASSDDDDVYIDQVRVTGYY